MDISQGLHACSAIQQDSLQAQRQRRLGEAWSSSLQNFGFAYLLSLAGFRCLSLLIKFLLSCILIIAVFLSLALGFGENTAERRFMKLRVSGVWVGKLVELNVTPVLILNETHFFICWID